MNKDNDAIKQLEKQQATLENNQTNVMEILEEIRWDLKEVKKFLFQWELQEKFVPREIFNDRVKSLEDKITEKEVKIDKLEKAQNKVAWLIISAVILAVLSMVVIPKLWI